MSLFERINKKITEEKKNQRDNSYLFDDNKDSSKNKEKPNQNKKFSKNIESGKTTYSKNKKLNQEISQRYAAQDRQQQRFSRQYDAYDDGDLGNPNDSKGYEDKTKTKTKTTKTFFDAEKAKVKREKLKQGRKAYIDPKTGKASKEGIVRYISKARDMKSGGNTNTRANRKAAEIISKSAGPEYAKKIEDKYGGNVSRTRRKDAKSLEQIKKDIDVKNPVKPGQFTGKPVPASTPVKKIKTAVTDKEIQDVLKTGRKTKPGKTKKITVGSLDARDKAIKDLDNLIIEPKSGDAKQTEKLLKKQRRIITKRITTPKPNEIEQSQKILDKSKPSSEKLFDPTGQKKKKLQQQNVDFNKFMKNLKTKSFVPPKTTPLVTPPKVEPVTQPLTEPLKKTRTLKKIKIKAPPKTQTGTFKKIMKFAGKNKSPILKTLGYTAAGAYLLSRVGSKTDNKPKNNPILGNRIKSGSVKPVDIKFTLSGKGGDGFKPAGMKK